MEYNFLCSISDCTLLVMNEYITKSLKMCCVCTSRVHTDTEFKAMNRKILAKDDREHMYMLYEIGI